MLRAKRRLFILPRPCRPTLPLACVIIACLLAFARPRLASAGPGSQPLRPAASAEADLSTESSQVLTAWTPSARLLNVYGTSMASSRSLGTGADVWKLRRRASSHLLLALGLFDHVELGLDLPLIVFQEGDAPGEPGDSLKSSGIADLRTTIKGTILPIPERGIGIGISLDLTFPTGDPNVLSGETGVTASPQVLLEHRTKYGIESAINLGYLVRPDIKYLDQTHGDMFSYRVMGRVPFGRHLNMAVVAELDGGIGIVDGSDAPLAARGGLRWRTKGGVILGLYAGGALISSLGLPDFSGMLGVGYVPAHRVRRERAFVGSPRPSAIASARRYERVAELHKPTPAPHPVNPDDLDQDGLLADADLCPQVKEDFDGFEDSDGCPEWDNDRDGLRDAIDLCPLAPEVINGYGDWDGCPDQRLADGTGVTTSQFDPAKVLPRIGFVAGSAALNKDGEEGVRALAELLRLNPWMGELEIKIEILGSQTEGADLKLASARAEKITGLLKQRGVQPWRVRVGTPTAVAPGRDEHAQLALRTTLSGLRPLAPSDPAFERLISDAVRAARAKDALDTASTVDPVQHSGTHTPRLDPSGVEVMAQGPEKEQVATPPRASHEGRHPPPAPAASAAKNPKPANGKPGPRDRDSNIPSILLPPQHKSEGALKTPVRP